MSPRIHSRYPVTSARPASAKMPAPPSIRSMSPQTATRITLRRSVTSGNSACRWSRRRSRLRSSLLISSATRRARGHRLDDLVLAPPQNARRPIAACASEGQREECAPGRTGRHRVIEIMRCAVRRTRPARWLAKLKRQLSAFAAGLERVYACLFGPSEALKRKREIAMQTR
jgi:hypothetical protein